MTDTKEVFTDCTLCYHSCGTKVTIEDGRAVGVKGLENSDIIFIKTNTGEVKMKACVDGRVAEGVVLVPHGWGGEANGNLLTDVTCREPIMGYPDQKSLQCTIGRV
ncbi:MAG: hypothetical protein JRH15_00430 [Deltaproteobacteria bacterium]|nr:hypothetical protein [Deltaproteobacteria bacterium]